MNAKDNQKDLQDISVQKNDSKFFDKTWDQYVYTLCLIILGFNYVSDHAQYSNLINFSNDSGSDF